MKEQGVNEQTSSPFFKVPKPVRKVIYSFLDLKSFTLFGATAKKPYEEVAQTLLPTSKAESNQKLSALDLSEYIKTVHNTFENKLITLPQFNQLSKQGIKLLFSIQGLILLKACRSVITQLIALGDDYVLSKIIENQELLYLMPKEMKCFIDDLKHVKFEDKVEFKNFINDFITDLSEKTGLIELKSHVAYRDTNAKPQFLEEFVNNAEVGSFILRPSSTFGFFCLSLVASEQQKGNLKIFKFPLDVLKKNLQQGKSLNDYLNAYFKDKPFTIHLSEVNEVSAFKSLAAS